MGGSVSTLSRWAWLTGLLVVPLAILTGLVAISNDISLRQRCATALILMVIVIGLHVFSGNSGVISFGTTAFAMISAYTSALLTIPAKQKPSLFPQMPDFLKWILDVEVPIPIGILIAVAFTAIVAFLVGIPLVRLSGLAAGIGTLAFLFIVTVIVTKWKAVTRGESTMVGVPGLKDTSLWWALGGVTVAIAIAAWFQMTRRGRRLIATREDDKAAMAIGISVPVERMWGWVLSASIAGLGGALYGHYIASFSASTFGAAMTFFTLAMLVIGGLGSLTGAVVGVLVIQILSEFLRTIETQGLGPIPIIEAPGLTEMVLALIMLLVLILRPEGITGGKEITSWFRRRGAMPPTMPVSTTDTPVEVDA
jgi:branched-chain amino acid transport system permease protein